MQPPEGKDQANPPYTRTVRAHVIQCPKSKKKKILQHYIIHHSLSHYWTHKQKKNIMLHKTPHSLLHGPITSQLYLFQLVLAAPGGYLLQCICYCTYRNTSACSTIATACKSQVIWCGLIVLQRKTHWSQNYSGWMHCLPSTSFYNKHRHISLSLTSKASTSPHAEMSNWWKLKELQMNVGNNLEINVQGKKEWWNCFVGQLLSQTRSLLTTDAWLSLATSGSLPPGWCSSGAVCCWMSPLRDK